DDDDDEDLPADADRGVASIADEIADHGVIDDALKPADDVGEHRWPRELPDRGGKGAIDDRAIVSARLSDGRTRPGGRGDRPGGADWSAHRRPLNLRCDASWRR